ncbi:hypothetical protein [Nocardia sp. NRRL WC-3656]|uniref:hypothetical protein n=1 Tax=Nocardia sp. NRRL WC-3656 TaxID=1463824 RepID=UPI0012DF20AE|nr:hypothetical protein [Nocardia sp. NRRL WC-3656]
MRLDLSRLVGGVTSETKGMRVSRPAVAEGGSLVYERGDLDRFILPAAKLSRPEPESWDENGVGHTICVEQSSIAIWSSGGTHTERKAPTSPSHAER